MVASESTLHHHRPPRFALPRRRTTAVALAAVAAAAGVFTLGRTDTSSSTGTSISASAQMPLTERVLTPSTLHGFAQTEQPPAIHGAAQWAAIAEQSPSVTEAARLEKLGFVAGVQERLHGLLPLKAEAISTAEQFRTAGGARAELAAQYQQAVNDASMTGAKVRVFAVAGIPGALAWTASGKHTSAVNVSFAVGSYYYLVGSGFPTGTHRAPGQTQLTQAAQSIYLTISGCVTSHVSASTAS
jgi:hypothetical protein